MVFEHKKIKKRASLFMAGVMLSLSFSLNAFAENEINTPVSIEESVISGSAVSVANDNIDVVFAVTGKWENGFNGEITITNIGNTKIENWQIYGFICEWEPEDEF